MAELLNGEALRRRVRLALDVPLVSALEVRLLDPLRPPAGAVFAVTGLADSGAGGAHAAALGAVMALAAYLALTPSLTEDEHAVTHASSIQLISWAVKGDVVEVRGHLERRTKRLAFATAIASVSDRVVAHAQLTKSIIPFRI